MESKFFHASLELKHFSILPQKVVLHYNSLGKCRKRRFGSFCESECKHVQKTRNKGKGVGEGVMNSSCCHSTLSS